MDYIDFDIPVPRLQTVTGPTGDATQVLVDERVAMRIPILASPALAATVFDINREEHAIYHADGAFYAVTATRFERDPEAVLTGLFHSARNSQQGVLRDDDVKTMGQRFAVHDEEDLLLERIHEPVWIVETRDAGGRMNTRENAKQAVSTYFSYRPGQLLQDFDARAVSPFGSPCVMFNAMRFVDAERLLPGVAADTGWGQVANYRNVCIDVLRPDLFVIDDRAGSIRMIGSMMISLGHTVCPALSRGGVERWVELRRRLAADPSGEQDYAGIQDVVAGLLRELRGLRSENKELDVMLKRARNCAALFVHRLDMDNTYEYASAAVFDADLSGLSP